MSASNNIDAQVSIWSLNLSVDVRRDSMMYCRVYGSGMACIWEGAGSVAHWPLLGGDNLTVEFPIMVYISNVVIGQSAHHHRYPTSLV
jgi:hypothetical protein